jgi:hypothetical protein
VGAHSNFWMVPKAAVLPLAEALIEGSVVPYTLQKKYYVLPKQNYYNCVTLHYIQKHA